jgi:hypothetical protein
MLTVHKAIWVLVFCLALIGESLAQTFAPIPSPGESRQPEQIQPSPPETPAATDQRGTDQSPLVVKVLPAPAQNNSGEPPRETSDKSPADWFLVIFAGLLVIVSAGQGIMFVLQTRRFHETVQMLMSGESALIFLSEPNAGLLLPGGNFANEPESPGVPLPLITCQFINVGRTTAVIKEIRGELLLGTQFPREPTYNYSQAKRAELVAMPEKKTVEQRFEYDRNFTAVEIELIKERKVGILFFGYVKYSDIFGRQHSKGFGLICRGPNKFQAWGGPSYNYARAEIANNQITKLIRDLTNNKQ